MNRLTPEQRLQIVELYYQNQCSVKKVYRALRPLYGRYTRPTETTIRNTINKLQTTFTLLDSKPPTRMRTMRTDDNIAIVEASVAENPNLSIRKRSNKLGLCPSTLWKILHKDKNDTTTEIDADGIVGEVDAAGSVADAFGSVADNNISDVDAAGSNEIADIKVDITTDGSSAVQIAPENAIITTRRRPRKQFL